MIDRLREIIDRRAVRISLGIGGLVLAGFSFKGCLDTQEQQLTTEEIVAIESDIGKVASDSINSDRPFMPEVANKQDGTDESEISKLSYDLSPIVSIEIAGIIKDKKVVNYDWQNNINSKTRVVEYDPGNNFNDMFVSVEHYDKEDDGVVDEQRGRLGLKVGELLGVVFAFGHTDSSPEDDAIMDKVDEVKVGDIVKAKTKDGITYVFTVNAIMLAKKTDPYDEAKLCGSGGRVFTCFVNNDDPTNRSQYLCLKFKGIENGNRTILAEK